LVPKEVVTTAPAEEAVARGRSLARAARCDACHEVEEPAFQELPEPLAAKAWSAIKIGEGKCALPAGRAVFHEVGSLPSKLEVASKLKIALKADGCLSCHVRDGEGGLPPAVRKHLREVEDIGEEGLVPPDLSSVGRRLRPAWLERVVREGHKSRDYVVMRMPAYGDVKAKQYAEWFGAVDAADVVDEEPPFSVEAAELGRTLAGIGGRNCISCHAMSGRDSLGPQGMDLAMQHQRLRPGWFRDWLLKPLEMRKNTRMPQLWLSGTEQDTLDVDAIRTWLSLGESAPLPTGVVVDPSLLVLVPVDRPILHGAFLKDVSARCLAVGTPARTHFAFDLVKPRLAWIWRGDFLDATGTWHGRAGKLVEPLGKDWQVVDDFTIEGETTRRLLGQRRTDDGYPVVRVGCGDARYEDQVTARLAANGSELVRVIRCEAGTLVLNFPTAPSYKALVQGKPASQHTLTAGQSLEVIYQW
jgi:mono/diheme cytochrome c family protein